jgi:hypothetical protein
MAPLPGVPGDELASAGMKRKLPPPTQAEIQPANIAPRTTRFEKKEGYGFEDSFGETDGRSFHRYDYHTLCLLLHHVLKVMQNTSLEYFCIWTRHKVDWDRADGSSIC